MDIRHISGGTMTLPNAGAPHVYPKPTVSDECPNLPTAVMKLINTLFVQSVFGEDEFELEITGVGQRGLGSTITLKNGPVKVWECDLDFFADGERISKAVFFPSNTDHYNAYALHMEMISYPDTSAIYYEIRNRNGNILKTFGISLI